MLKVGHHGSTTPAFLSAVDPSVAVISSGDENTFRHPSPTTRLRLAGVPLLRTDENGDVRFETDGASLWVDSSAATTSSYLSASQGRANPDFPKLAFAR